MTDRELMQEALYALTYVGDAKEIYSDTIESLRARLAQPEQEHSEQWWRHEVSNAWAEGYEKGRASAEKLEQKPVAWADKYDIEAEREWQGLTEMEIMDICNFAKGQNGFFLVREVEAKLKEKNGTS